MRNIKWSYLLFLFIQFLYVTALAQTNDRMMHDMYRPQAHFSPAANWMNDPNGMVYSKGIYHLFFQYHPYSTVWGPMHWGHATSTDMIHWKEQPIAIYPDSIGTIFSGSVVVDKNNTSGFGKNGQSPLVAIFTQHNMEGEKAGKNNFQNQSIGYSLDEGKTWIKYPGNPVIKNLGLKDFRDPKVMWYAPQKKWIMALAVKDFISFYSSPNLKSWTKESDFGEGRGAHGGGWECPDLITLDDNGKQRWALIVNLNPGGPNGGSATQYFVGDFDGRKFTSKQKETQWLDYGPDNYAGVTWSNTGQRKLFLGWMSNWLYATVVPTERWRSAMTLPRELKLKHVGKDIFISSLPVNELTTIYAKPRTFQNVKVTKPVAIETAVKFPCRLNLTGDQLNDFSITLSNDEGEELVFGYDKNKNQYFIDRTKSGKTDFQKDFAARHVAPRLSNLHTLNLSFIIDASSIELFADDGLTVMTEIFFSTKPYTKIYIQARDGIGIKRVEYIGLASIWK